MIVEPLMYKNVLGNTDLELEAEAGESLLVLDILAYNAASSYMTITIDKAAVGYFRVGTALGSHQCINFANPLMGLGFGGQSPHPDRSVLSILRSLGKFSGYPIGEGQKLTISGVAQANAVQVVIYQKGKPGDFTPDQMNGSDSNEFLFLNYGRVAASVSTSGDTVLNTPQTPSQFPSFPFGTEVPGNYEMTLHGILASDFTDDQGGNDEISTDYLKLIKDRITLFDEDRNGLLMAGPDAPGGGSNFGTGRAVIGNASEVDERPPLIFPEPLLFLPGQELGVYWTTTVDAGWATAEMTAVEGEVCFIQTAKRIR
ncbi:MAG: hypothetical protein GF393_12925 [Armatimonadia bacterium]|nr:hypothetical protein [Armatimonadia bacterium]